MHGLKFLTQKERREEGYKVKTYSLYTSLRKEVEDFFWCHFLTLIKHEKIKTYRKLWNLESFRNALCLYLY